LITFEVEPNDEGENEDLLFWITEPGEEYFMHMSLWRDVPFTFKLGKSIESSDLTLKKVVKTTEDDCNSDANYDYISKHSIF
jgi:hypothetical protein